MLDSDDNRNGKVGNKPNSGGGTIPLVSAFGRRILGQSLFGPPVLGPPALGLQALRPLALGLQALGQSPFGEQVHDSLNPPDSPDSPNVWGSPINEEAEKEVCDCACRHLRRSLDPLIWMFLPIELYSLKECIVYILKKLESCECCKKHQDGKCRSKWNPYKYNKDEIEPFIHNDNVYTLTQLGYDLHNLQNNDHYNYHICNCIYKELKEAVDTFFVDQVMNELLQELLDNVTPIRDMFHEKLCVRIRELNLT